VRCENLVGAVEVVLRSDAQRNETMRLGKLPDKGDNASEVRQLTGCTSPTTTVTFPLLDGTSQHQPQTHWTDIYVVDAWGSVLAREDMPKSPR